MRMSPQCQAEGCVNRPKWFIYDFDKGWVWVACDDHEVTKKPEELSVLIPQPPEPP